MKTALLMKKLYRREKLRAQKTNTLIDKLISTKTQNTGDYNYIHFDELRSDEEILVLQEWVLKAGLEKSILNKMYEQIYKIRRLQKCAPNNLRELVRCTIDKASISGKLKQSLLSNLRIEIPQQSARDIFMLLEQLELSSPCNRINEYPITNPLKSGLEQQRLRRTHKYVQIHNILRPNQPYTIESYALNDLLELEALLRIGYGFGDSVWVDDFIKDAPSLTQTQRRERVRELSQCKFEPNPFAYVEDLYFDEDHPGDCVIPICDLKPSRLLSITEGGLNIRVAAYHAEAERLLSLSIAEFNEWKRLYYKEEKATRTDEPSPISSESPKENDVHDNEPFRQDEDGELQELFIELCPDDSFEDAESGTPITLRHPSCKLKFPNKVDRDYYFRDCLLANLYVRKAEDELLEIEKEQQRDRNSFYKRAKMLSPNLASLILLSLFYIVANLLWL